MASLKDIKRRISAVRCTQKVTRAMQLVAAAKLKRAQNAAQDARSYTGGLYETTMRVSRRLGDRAPLLWRRSHEINSIDVVVITSDRGLCGGFNENLLRIVDDGIGGMAEHNIEVKIYALGKKGSKYLTRKNHNVEEIVPKQSDKETALWLGSKMIERYKSGKTAGSVLAFNKFVTTAKQAPTFWNILPLYKRGTERERFLEYLYEPERAEALDDLCKLFVEATLRQAILESRAAEYAARMIAMDNATKNADDVIANLTFIYNRARQNAITSELMDIVGGAEALR